MIFDKSKRRYKIDFEEQRKAGKINNKIGEKKIRKRIQKRAITAG